MAARKAKKKTKKKASKAKKKPATPTSAPKRRPPKPRNPRPAPKWVDVDELRHIRLSVDQVGEIFGLSADRIQVYAKTEGLPRITRGQYSLLAVLEWWRHKLNDQAAAEDSSLTEERRRLVIVQREREEIGNAKLRGELIPADEVEQIINQLSVTFASQLDGLPARVAMPLASVDDPAIIQGKLQDECRSIRSATSADVQDFASSYGGFADPGAAAGA